MAKYMDSPETTIDHTIRIKLRLNTLEYCVADFLHRGLADKVTLEEFLGLVGSQIQSVIDSLERKQIVAIGEDRRIRLTQVWSSEFKTTKRRLNIQERMIAFRDSVRPYSKKVGGEYDSKMLLAFYEYWVEPNPSKTKMRFEMEKTWDLKLRLIRWANNNFNKDVGPDQSRTLINGAING